MSRRRADARPSWVRDLGLDDADLRIAVTASASWWANRAKEDAKATTELSEFLARDHTLTITYRKPQRFEVERQEILDKVSDPVSRNKLLANLKALWAIVPYPASLSRRAQLVRGRDEPVGVIELADLLADIPIRSLRTAELPPQLCRAADRERVDTLKVARRIDAADDSTLAELNFGWLPRELQALGKGIAPQKYLRALFGCSSATVCLLCCYGAAHPRRYAQGEMLLAGIAQLERLIECTGDGDDDPAYGFSRSASDVTITVGDVVDFEVDVETRFYHELARTPAPGPTQRDRAVRLVTKGFNALLDVLDAGADAGARIEARPRIELEAGVERGRGRRHWSIGDDMLPRPEELAQFIAVGIDELAGPEDDELLKAFLFAWSTGCRPKESSPCAEDFAPLGAHQMIYLDRQTGKTGARELYLPACAERYFGVGPSWFSSRRWPEEHPMVKAGLAPRRATKPKWHEQLPNKWTAQAAQRLEEACRRVRARYEADTGRRFDERLAYIVRKGLSAWLWRQGMGLRGALTDVLGHSAAEADWPYARATNEEILSQNTAAIYAARTACEEP